MDVKQQYFDRIAGGLSDSGGMAERFEALKGETEPAVDPWAHRSAGMRCRCCMFFALKSTAAADDRGCLGRCRRHAPTMAGFPAVFETDWCGDHKLDETKI